MSWINLNKFYKNILALMLGLLISVIIAEIILRIYNPIPATVKGDSIVLRANYKTIWLNNTDSRFPPEIVVSGNSLGMRGPELPTTKAFKIITVGGSTTQSVYIPDGKTWIDILDLKLKNKYNNIWLNNAGLSGHSTFGHIIFMEDYIVSLKPDIVIFLLGANDLERKDPLDFRREQEFGFFDTSSYVNFIKTLLYRSELVGLLINLKRAYSAHRANITHGLGYDLTQETHVVISDEFRLEKIRRQKPYLQGYKDRLLELIEISRNNNITPIFITQPVLVGNQIDPTTGVDLSSIKGFMTVYPTDGRLAWELLELYNDITREVGVENNVHVIDLAKEMPKDSKYYRDLLHFTIEGSEKIAEIVSIPLLEILKKETLKPNKINLN